MKLGLDYRLIPLGSQPLHSVHFVDIIARVAMMFGGVSTGRALAGLLTYAQNGQKRSSIVFPGLSDEDMAFVDGMRVLGFPILSLADTKVGNGLLQHPQDVVHNGMDMKGIRVTVTAIPIPMACSPAFEGKSIRKEEMQVEFGGGRSPAFELLRMQKSPVKSRTER